MSLDAGDTPDLPSADEADYHPIDASMKALLRSHPEVLFRLAGQPLKATCLRLEDTAINLPEQRADHVFVVTDGGDQKKGVVYVEYQLHPRVDVLPLWFAKAGALGRQLNLPVVLLAVYLEKGRRANFPDEYAVSVSGLRSSYQFPIIRLWEHAGRIRNGELWQLAPLLVLCEDNPTERTLREEVALITRSGAPAEEQGELLAMALRVAGRKLPRTLVETVFREELPMIQGATIVDDWIAEGEARGEARGETRGELRGRTEEARRLTREAFTIRFGELPVQFAARLETADAEECDRLFRRVMTATSLSELLA